MPKKLLLISTAINTGSTGKIAEQIGQLAVNRGWESYVAHSCRYGRPTQLNDISTSSSISEKIHYLGALLTDGEGLYGQHNTKKLVKKIKELSPDIIHLHNIHGHYLNYLVLFECLKDISVPVVWTLHDCWPFTGHCVYFDRIGCEKWKTQCRDCPIRYSYPKSLVDRSKKNFQSKKKTFTSLKNVTIVPVSDWLGGIIQESFMGKYSVRTIHNGIDLNIFHPSESDFRKRYGIENKFVLLGVANGFGQRKGLEDFNLLSESLGDDVQVVMVGIHESEKKKVSSKIISMRRTENQQELRDIYSTADVFINPTYEDNFPTTNLEALACGTPVITYRTGGSPEAIDENSGIVVEKGDFDALLAAVKEIKIKGKKHYSDACLKRARNHFNMYDRFEEYINLYDNLLNKKDI